MTVFLGRLKQEHSEHYITVKVSRCKSCRRFAYLNGLNGFRYGKVQTVG